MSSWFALVLLISAGIVAAQARQTEAHPASKAPASAQPGADMRTVAVTDAERAALTVTAYDLTAQIQPADAHIGVLARLTVRNDGPAPLAHIALQISSSLHWESLGISGSAGPKPGFEQHRMETDADHTGAVSEAIVTLPHALAVGGSLSLTGFYAGTIERSAARLERIGVPPETAARVDWDRIDESGTWLRGFGDVLWYPVAAPAVFLGDGAALAQVAGEQKLRQEHASVKLRVTTSYRETTPQAMYFCGGRGTLKASSEDSDAPEGAGPGVASAEFLLPSLGFRPLSLFVLGRVPSEQGSALEVLPEEGHAQAVNKLVAGVAGVQPLLANWLGVSPLRRLTVIEQPGDSFADGAFVVTPIEALEPSPAITGALTHAWFRSAQPWLDEGVPGFMALLRLEQSSGRSAAIAQLDEQSHGLALLESNAPTGPAAPADGGLLRTSNPVLIRNKAAAVLWMLRGVTGDDALKQALEHVRADATLDRDPEGFERALEQTSGKRLEWFFADWVTHDRGLPDLSIGSVATRELSGRAGDEQKGALVVVEVSNAGGAVAEVPVTVRSGALTATERLRVPAHASATVRILFQGTPEEVQVNDGTVPELVSSTHTRRVVEH